MIIIILLITNIAIIAALVATTIATVKDQREYRKLLEEYRRMKFDQEQARFLRELQETHRKKGQQDEGSNKL